MTPECGHDQSDCSAVKCVRFTTCAQDYTVHFFYGQRVGSIALGALGYDSLKPEKGRALLSYLRGHDVSLFLCPLDTENPTFTLPYLELSICFLEKDFDKHSHCCFAIQGSGASLPRHVDKEEGRAMFFVLLQHCNCVRDR